MEFVSSNVWLVLAAVVSGGYLIFPKLLPGGAASKSIDPQAAVQLINRKHAVVIDVREPNEFQIGSVVGSRNIPLETLKDRIEEIKKLSKKPVIIVCANGVRSRSALRQLSTISGDELYVLSGGMSAWTQASLPVVSS